MFVAVDWHTFFFARIISSQKQKDNNSKSEPKQKQKKQAKERYAKEYASLLIRFSEKTMSRNVHAESTTNHHAAS
jgi:hypothetical protein